MCGCGGSFSEAIQLPLRFHLAFSLFFFGRLVLQVHIVVNIYAYCLTILMMLLLNEGFLKVELFMQNSKRLHARWKLYLFTGSPFLASEDGVLGGIIVLRCCRCGEDQSSGNLQALLGMFCTTSPAQHLLHI